MSTQAPEQFDQWAILELLGHVRVAGRVTEEERFGTKMGRIDIPTEGGTFTTQYFGGGSVYRLTPTTEEIAREVARSSQPRPVAQWELRGLNPAPASSRDEDDFDDADEDLDE